MEENSNSASQEAPVAAKGWGGWGISPLSMLSDLQKAASVAAEEISRNAVAVAKNAAKGISELQNVDPDSESVKMDEELEKSADNEEVDTDEDKIRRSALDKLEKASDDSVLGQGLKALDNSVENIASGAWQALGSAWRGGSNLVHKIEHSAANLAGSIQHGSLPLNTGSLAPSLIETGKAFTAKGMQVLELVGKETMELLIAETGIEVEKNQKKADQQADDEEQFLEEVTFDRCFYIYGGPEQLEELEALSNHYTLLYNRKKAKLSAEQKSFYDGKLRQVQQIFSLSTEIEGSGVDSDKGKSIETVEEGNVNEMKILRDSSVSKAADMAAGFTAALGGLAANEMIQRTVDRLETIHSEGVHRLSELCCFAVSQLLMLGKSVTSSANKSQNEDEEDDTLKIDWPEDSLLKAKIIRAKAQSMSGDVEAVSNSFITGISDVIESYLAALKGASVEAHDGLPQEASIQEKANTISDHLRAGRATAMDKIQDGLQYLAFVVLLTSMPSA
ncbi:BAT2 domain protein [Tasmannia lanceolata]|uniref:BAT2 domain protein n=1 Tax=Tasmannia lanceolata TaxID=3420 RepID=UPI004062AE21